MSSIARAAASALNGRKSKGPRTPEGRRISSLNRVSHGLSARSVLLPGEDAAAYEATLTSWAETLAPSTRAEAELVAQVADTSFRLERLTRLETGRTLQLIEEELERTDLFASLTATRSAFTLVHALAETLEACPEPPSHLSQLSGLLQGVQRTLTFLHEVPGLPPTPTLLLAAAHGALYDSAPGKEVNRGAYQGLGQAARELEAALAAKLAAEEAQLPRVREQLAAQVVLLDDEDLRRLERHRRLLETSLLRLLDALEKTRAAAAAGQRAEGSGAAKEHVVRLRLVKR